MVNLFAGGFCYILCYIILSLVTSLTIYYLVMYYFKLRDFLYNV